MRLTFPAWQTLNYHISQDELSCLIIDGEFPAKAFIETNWEGKPMACVEMTYDCDEIGIASAHELRDEVARRWPQAEAWQSFV